MLGPIFCSLQNQLFSIKTNQFEKKDLSIYTSRIGLLSKIEIFEVNKQTKHGNTNKTLMGHIAHQSNNSHNIISFMCQIQNIWKTQEKRSCIKRFTIFFQDILLSVKLWAPIYCNRMISIVISTIQHLSSHEDLEQLLILLLWGQIIVQEPQSKQLRMNNMSTAI